MPYMHTTCVREHTHTFFPHNCTPETGSFNFLPNLGAAHFSMQSFKSAAGPGEFSFLLVAPGKSKNFFKH